MGSPRASLVTRTPFPAVSCAMYIPVAAPSRLGLVASSNSSMPACFDRGGSFESSSIRRARGRARAVGTSHPRELQATGEASELVGGELLGFRERVGGRGAHQVLQCVDVFGIDRLLLYPDLFALLRAGHHDNDGPAAGRPLDRHRGQVLLRLSHVGLHLLGELLNVAEVLHSISMMRSGRPSVSIPARSIGSSVAAASGTPAWRTHFTRIVAFRISDRSCSSSERRLSCQRSRANSSPNPMTIVAPSIASGSALASRAALPMLRSRARSTSSPQALRTVPSFTTRDAAPALTAASVATRRPAIATTAARGASRRGSARVCAGAGRATTGRSLSRRASGGGATSLDVTKSRIASSSGRGVPSLVRRCCSVSTRRFAIFAS